MRLRFIFPEGSVLPSQFEFPKYFIGSSHEAFVKQDGEKFLVDFGEIKRINFFVGANNSGKSRFLRGLFSFPRLYTQVYSTSAISDIIESLKKHSIFQYIPKSAEEKRTIIDMRKRAGDMLKMLEIHVKKVDFMYHSHFSNFENRISSLENILNPENIFFKGSGIKNDATRLLVDFRRKLLQFKIELEFWKENYCASATYIPPLRSLLKCQYLEENNLQDLAVKFLMVEENSGFSKIFTGLDLYKNVMKIRNSRNSNKIRNFEKFIGDNFFEGSRIELIPDEEESKVLLLKVNNEEDRSLNEIGDGIQAIILLLFPIFTADNSSWIFIEEPETHLHPGLQRLFIETLLNDGFLKEKKLRYFFTTHSNHFLDISLKSDNIGIFQFQKEKENEHLIKPNITPSKDVLDVLGVNTSSVFLANTSIWVEGPTDRKYLSKFLYLYCTNKRKALREDIDFSFFEYGGNLIKHYLFDEGIEIEDTTIREKINSFALSNKIFLFADSDNASSESSKFKRRQELEALSNQSNNFEFQSTNVVEIENLLPVSTIKGFMNSLVSEKQESLDTIDFSQNDYSEIRLGEFYSNLLGKVGVPEDEIKAFKAQSGTLKNHYKLKLCDYFIEQKINYNQLISENSILEEKIKVLFNFISQ